MRELSYVGYVAAGLSVALSIAAWARAGGSEENQAHAERWGLFVGLWAPTLAVAGVACAMEATRQEVTRTAHAG